MRMTVNKTIHRWRIVDNVLYHIEICTYYKCTDTNCTVHAGLLAVRKSITEGPLRLNNPTCTQITFSGSDRRRAVWVNHGDGGAVMNNASAQWHTCIPTAAGGDGQYQGCGVVEREFRSFIAWGLDIRWGYMFSLPMTSGNFIMSLHRSWTAWQAPVPAPVLCGKEMLTCDCCDQNHFSQKPFHEDGWSESMCLCYVLSIPSFHTEVTNILNIHINICECCNCNISLLK